MGYIANHAVLSGAYGMALNIQTQLDGDVAVFITKNDIPIGDNCVGGLEIEFCASGEPIRSNTRSGLKRLMAAAHGAYSHPELPLWGGEDVEIVDDMHSGNRTLSLLIGARTVRVAIKARGRVLQCEDGRAIIHFPDLPSHVVAAFKDLAEGMRLDK